MLLPNSVFFCLIISHLLPFSLGNTIPLDRNVHLADEPGLDGAPNADSSKVSSRDLEVQFGPEPGLDGAPKSDSPKIFSRDLEVQFAPDPELNGAAKSDSSKVSSRDLEVLFGPEPGPNGAPKPDSPKVSSRDLEVQFGPDPELSGAAKSGSSKVSSRDLDVQFAADPALDGTPNPNGPPLSPRAPSGLDKLLQNDQRCAHRKNWHRSVDLEKRAKPSDVLWNVGQAVVVQMGLAAWHAWGQAPEAIGTYGLCGCTAVAIVGQAGAIVAHIQPNQAQFQNQMNHIRNLYQTHIQGQTLPRVFLMTPALNNVVQVQAWQDQVRSALTALGVSVQEEPYPMVVNGGARDGTLVVQRIAGAIKVWLNEKLISSS